LLFHLVLEFGEAGETSVDGNVIEHLPDDAGNQRPSFLYTGLDFVFDKSPYNLDRKLLSAST
jgi:hypothetical protein